MTDASPEWPTQYARVLLDETDSTMAEAQRRAKDVTAPTWIMARRQTAGRGRGGRPWIAPAGNLSATLLLPKPGGALQAAQRSFVAALALRAALRGAAAWDDGHPDGARISLKWPNDVLVDGRKIAGILLEAHGAGPQFLAIGIGVNLATAPPGHALEDRALPPIALADIADPDLPETFLTRLASAYAAEETTYRTYGFAPIRTGWMQRAARLGEVVTARTGTETLTGRFVDVDKDGQLVLETANSTRHIPAADVYF